MFGVYRYALACCVVISHLFGEMRHFPSAFAVWGFYTLSGYLMTLVLHEKYGFRLNGLRAFAINRALRIYPGYYAASLLTVAVYLLIPGSARAFWHLLRLPVNARNWLHALTLFWPMQIDQPEGGGEFIHGSSALYIEVWFYVFMALGLAKRQVACVWFAASIAYTIYLVRIDADFLTCYVTLLACSLPFSLGSCLYHIRDYLPKLRSPCWAAGTVLLGWAYVHFEWDFLEHLGLFGTAANGRYCSLIFASILMFTLWRLNPKQLPRPLSALDRLAGDLSYPIYLIHWAVGICVFYCIGTGRGSATCLLISFPIVNLVAWGIYRFAEEPMRNLKTKPRPAAKETAPIRARSPQVELAEEATPL